MKLETFWLSLVMLLNYHLDLFLSKAWEELLSRNLQQKLFFFTFPHFPLSDWEINREFIKFYASDLRIFLLTLSPFAADTVKCVFVICLEDKISLKCRLWYENELEFLFFASFLRTLLFCQLIGICQFVTTNHSKSLHIRSENCYMENIEASRFFPLNLKL